MHLLGCGVGDGGGGGHSHHRRIRIRPASLDHLSVGRALGGVIPPVACLLRIIQPDDLRRSRRRVPGEGHGRRGRARACALLAY